MISVPSLRSTGSGRLVVNAANAALLSALDLAAVIVAFGFYCLFRPSHQLLFQGPLAALIVVVSFLAAQRLIASSPVRSFRLAGWKSAALVYVLAFVLAAVAFIPLHLATQGYLSSGRNIVGLWLFQAPTNALALSAAILLGSSRESSRPS